MRGAALLFTISLTAGCGSDPTELRFNVDKDLPPQSIDASIAPCQLPIPVSVLAAPFQVTFTQEEDFPEQDTDIAHVKSARLKRLELELTASSPEQSWDFLDSISIFVEAAGHERRLVASIGEGTPSEEPIEPGATRLELDPEKVNLAPYIKANGGFTMTSEAEGCPPEEEAIFDGEIVVSIVADPL
jgi:hypothetical protein